MANNISWEGLEAFVAVVDAGSFSGAARALGLAKSTVSQRVAELEDHIGQQLLIRTTRQMRLTDSGEDLHRRGSDIMTSLREAEAALATKAEEVTGQVRVSAPVSLGWRFLGKVTTELLDHHPSLRLDVDLSDRAVDLIEGGYDLALRVGEVVQAGLISRKIGQARRLVVGAPSYFESHGRPSTPEALKEHKCLRFTFQRQPDVWKFDDGNGRETRIRISGPLSCNNGDLLANAAVEGAGLAWLPEFIVAPLITDGCLEAVLTDRCASTLPVVTVFPERRHRPLRVRVVADALRRALETSKLT